MKPPEGFTGANTRVSDYSAKGRHGETDKLSSTNQTEPSQVITYRKILGVLLMLSFFGITGTLANEQTRDVSGKTAAAHAACEASFENARRVVCDLAQELERVRDIKPEKNSRLDIFIVAGIEGKSISSSSFHLDLDSIDIEKEKKLSETLNELNWLETQQGFDVFGSISYTRYVEMGNNTYGKPQVLSVTDVFTALSYKDTSLRPQLKIWHHFYFSILPMPIFSAGPSYGEVQDFILTLEGDPREDGPANVYYSGPGLVSRIPITAKEVFEFANRYAIHLRPAEQQLFVTWIREHPPAKEK